MKSEMLPVLRLFAQKYQRFPNGFMHYLDRDAENFKDGGYIPRLLSGAEDETAWNNVHEKSDGVRVCLPKDGFAHMYYEPSSNFMCGINEMLLQSHDGLIRVFPAVQDDYTAMFTLLAQGNFLVTSEMIGGEIMYIAVKSLSGGKCKVQSPWQCDFNVKNGTEGIQFQIEGDAAVFETECGGTYVMERVEYPLAMYYTCAIAAKKEPGVKKLGTAVLGIERQY
jgi:alpha-L-fucosidase 2